MKIKVKLLYPVLLGVLIFFSCNKEDSSKAPVIPPFETMVIDFGEMTASSAKSETVEGQTEILTKTNWAYSAISVGFWNVMIGTTLAVPVASFHAASNKMPVQLDDHTWQWSYSVDGFTSQYTARLVGEIQTNRIKWEMYVSKTGVNPFDEFLWFEGTSNTDGKSGQWILYLSPEFQEEVIQIDWKKEGNDVGEVKYTYVRELNNDRMPDDYKGSYLIYGLQDQVFDAFVSIHVYQSQSDNFTDSFIEWSHSDFSGRVKALAYFGDNDWHCWDSNGNDLICEE